MNKIIRLLLFRVEVLSHSVFVCLFVCLFVCFYLSPDPGKGAAFIFSHLPNMFLKSTLKLLAKIGLVFKVRK